MKKATLVLALTILHCFSIAYAGSVWQKQSDEPCAGQVIVGDSGDGNDSYIVGPSSADYEVEEDYDYEYEVEEPDSLVEGDRSAYVDE